MNNWLRVVDGSPTGDWETAAASDTEHAHVWGGFICFDLGPRVRASHSLRQAVDGVLCDALDGQQNFFTSFEASVLHAVVSLPDGGQASKQVLGGVVDRLAEAFPHAKLVEATVEYSDPEAVYLQPTPNGLEPRLRPTVVRDD